MRPFTRSSAYRLLSLLLCACLAAGLLPVYGEETEPPENTVPAEKQVLLYLAEPLPDNQPYAMDHRKYVRDIAVPLLSGERGRLIRKTTQVATWLFPVSYAQGTPALRLSLEGIHQPTSISVNGVLLSADQPVAVPLKEVAELRVANEQQRGMIRLTFTNLPVIQIKNDGNIYKDVDDPCTVTVFDPDYLAHGLEAPLTVYDGVVSRRGGSSARFADKHPYNFSLMKDGQKWDQPLLGMRKDSDWLLDSAYIDRSRMRNRVLMDVWHEIYRLPWDQTLSGATRGVYVELFVGTHYRGLYVLGEKQDRRQLGLAKPGGKWNSSFFRTGETGSNSASPAGFVSLGKYRPGKEDPQKWYNIELRYPKGSGVDYAAHWNDFYEFTRLVVKGTPEEFAAEITRYADLENLALYWLFANAADMTDNMRKNMSFARLDDQDPRFNRYQLIPWDMDASLGRLYSSRRSKDRQLISNRLFDRLIAENPQDFRGTAYTLWQKLREGPLSADGIMKHFENYFSIISESGADRREMEKFPTFTSYVTAQNSYKLNFEAELKYIREYTERRIAWMDGMVEEQCGRQ